MNKLGTSDKPEADGSTVVCVKCTKEQFLHVATLPDEHYLTMMIAMMTVIMMMNLKEIHPMGPTMRLE